MRCIPVKVKDLKLDVRTRTEFPYPILSYHTNATSKVVAIILTLTYIVWYPTYNRIYIIVNLPFFVNNCWKKSNFVERQT